MCAILLRVGMESLILQEGPGVDGTPPCYVVAAFHRSSEFPGLQLTAY